MHICRYNVTYTEIKTLHPCNFVKSDQNDSHFGTKLFLHQINKILQLKRVKFWSQVPFKVLSVTKNGLRREGGSLSAVEAR